MAPQNGDSAGLKVKQLPPHRADKFTGANFGFDDDFMYNNKKFFYGFDIEHKGYKRKNEKNLSIFGNLYDYHLSMYKMSAHFQHPVARVNLAHMITLTVT